ncbi:glutamate racemase [Natronospora cellulosivora (SeqCode)]
MRIGFFDSGIGGLTVLKDTLNYLPRAKYLYYADTLNVPYGTKTRSQVRNYIFRAADFIFQKNIDALLIACNTATSIAIKDLREKYDIPIIGMEPAVKPALERCGNKRVLVTATPLTLEEDKYENLVSRLNADDKVDSLALPELVEFAESFEFDERTIKNYFFDKLSSFNLDLYGTIVLGCTHFIYYKKILSKILPSHIDIIDGNLGTVKHLLRVLKLTRNKYTKESHNNERFDISYYVSGKARKLDSISKYIKYLADAEQER